MRYGGQVVAVLTHHQTALAADRHSPVRWRSPTWTAPTICSICSPRELFPTSGTWPMSRSTPRAGDGFIRLDVARRRRLRQPQRAVGLPPDGPDQPSWRGTTSIEVTRPLISDPFEAQEVAEHVRDSLAGGSSMRMEVDAGGATVLLRTLPLVVDGASAGAAVLIRDVTEVKRRDRALMSKDATIREIHHRVKNNLQTVAALLRLQARRTSNAEGREALIESVRRVSSIALVHDALSMSVDEEVNLDEVDRPDPADHERRRVGGSADPHQPGRRPGRAGLRPGHRADHGDHRAGAERDRARLRPGGRGGHGDDPRRALRALARRRGPRRRSRTAGGIQPGELRQPGICRSCGPWCRPSWTARWACTRRPTRGTDVVLRVPIGRRTRLLL